MRRRRGGIRALAAVVAFGVAGCAASTHTVVTDADRSLVALLLPHHHLGMLLVDEATVRTDDVRLRRLVFEMGSYHSTEIDLLEQLADDWDVAAATTFPGDLTSSQLSALAEDDTDHDTMWLRLMIEHHEGALEIVTAYLDDVEPSDASDRLSVLARSVQRVQREELVEMRRLLDDLCASVAASRACDQ